MREKTCALIDLIDEGSLNGSDVAKALLGYMSEDDVRDFIVSEGYDDAFPSLSDAPEFDEEDDTIDCCDCPFYASSLCSISDCPTKEQAAELMAQQEEEEE